MAEEELETQEAKESTTEGVSPQDVPTMSPPDEEVTEEVSPSGVPTASPQGVPTDGKAKRIDLKLPATLRPVLGTLRQDEESDAAVVKRILESVPTLHGRIVDLVSTNEHLQKANTEIRETLKEEQERHEADYGVQVEEIGQLRARITTLENSAGTAVVPTSGQTSIDSFGIKDVVEDAREMCGDDDICNKVIGKMIDLKAHFASKAVDHEHVAEENRLDREQKELDRKSREEQAEKEREEKVNDREEKVKDREEKVKDRESRERIATQEQENKLEMQLMKKGIVRKSFLEDAAFANIASIPKRPKGAIKNKKKQAYREAEEEEEFGDDWDSTGEPDEQ